MPYKFNSSRRTVEVDNLWVVGLLQHSVRSVYTGDKSRIFMREKCSKIRRELMKLVYTRRIRSRAASVPRRPLLANPNLFRKPKMVFRSTVRYAYHQLVVRNGTRVVDS